MLRDDIDVLSGDRCSVEHGCGTTDNDSSGWPSAAMVTARGYPGYGGGTTTLAAPKNTATQQAVRASNSIGAARAVTNGFASRILRACGVDGEALDHLTGEPLSLADALLLESGEEPRAVLRYQIAASTKTESTMHFGFASLTTTGDDATLDVLPGVRLRFVAGPSVRTAGGSRWDEHVVESRAIIPEDMPRRVARDLQAGAAVLKDVGGWIERDDRGIVLATDLNERARRSDVPTRLLVMLVNARTTLADVPLPAEPVGLGARWETRNQLKLYGFKVSQVNTYTLVGRVGDELKLKVTTQQTALPQTVSFPEDGLTIVVDSYSSTGAGEIINNLHALSTEATARGESQSKLTVTSVDGTETIQTERVFEFQLANTLVEIPARQSTP